MSGNFENIFVKAQSTLERYFSVKASGLDYVVIPFKEACHILCATARVVRDFAIWVFRKLDAILSGNTSFKSELATQAQKTLEDQAESYLETCYISYIVLKALAFERKKMGKMEQKATVLTKALSN